MGDTLFYQYIDRLSLFYNYFAFLDTDAYLADQLFIKCGCTSARNMYGVTLRTV